MSVRTIARAIKYHEAVISETHPATYDPSFPARWNVGLDSYAAMRLLERYTFLLQGTGTAPGLAVASTTLHIFSVGHHHGLMSRDSA